MQKSNDKSSLYLSALQNNFDNNQMENDSMVKQRNSLKES